MNVYFTFDYELFFGNYSGSVDKCMIKPTQNLISIANKYNAKFTFFVDSGFLIKLNEFRRKYKILDNDYKKVIDQIVELDKAGHSIQLHIHPHWEDSCFDGEKWIINTSRYRLHQFSKDEIEDIVYRYKKILTDIVGDKVFAYRAGGWCVQPFDKIKDALKKNNIWLDSTIFYGGKNISQTHYYDFTYAPKKDMWKFEDDPLVENQKGFFTELPISYQKVMPVFFWKFAYTKKILKNDFKIFGDGQPTKFSKIYLLKKLFLPSYDCVSCDGYKSSLLEKNYKIYKKKGYKNFVIIGHPKTQNKYSLKKIEKFISDKNYEFFKGLKC